MSKYVIYSALIGAYDDIPQPEVVDDRFDFILFTNEVKASRVGVWQIRPISYENTDATRIARYVKTHPETLLPRYDASIWIDMNVLIKTDYLYDKVVRLKSDNVLVSSMCHPSRDCVYEEAFSLMHMRYERESVVLKWCRRIRKEKYPVHNGLCETNVLFRQHTGTVRSFNELWWACIDGNSRRDQLSFNYVLWKKGIPCHYLMGEEMCVRNTEHFGVIKHNNRSHNIFSFGRREAWLMRYCWKETTKVDIIKAHYYRLYAMPFPSLFAFLLGQFYRLKYLVENRMNLT